MYCAPLLSPILTAPQKSKGSGAGLRSSYLRVCHLELSSGESVSAGAGSSLLGGQRWTAAEEEEFAEMARYRDAKGGIFERFARSVAPSIYGNPGILYLLVLIKVKLKGVCRHKEGCGMLAHGWLKENATGRDASARRHQRSPAR